MIEGLNKSKLILKDKIIEVELKIDECKKKGWLMRESMYEMVWVYLQDAFISIEIEINSELDGMLELVTEAKKKED